MSDTQEKVNIIWPWFNGNGNIGAKDRLQSLEDMSNGKENCTAMTKINDHKAWHEKMSGRRWEIYVGFLLILIGQLVSFLLSRG